MNPADNIWEPATSASDLLQKHVQGLQSLLSSLDLDAVDVAACAIDRACQNGSMIYCAGNGGSAATASHIATDLFWGRRLNGENRPKAVSLVSSDPLITALGNDVGYDGIFVEQMNGFFKAGDVLVAISASGNSPNILKAVDFAKANGGTAIGLVGFDGGKLNGSSDISIHISSPAGAYELVEDVHHAVCHMLANCLKFKAAQRQA